MLQLLYENQQVHRTIGGLHGINYLITSILLQLDFIHAFSFLHFTHMHDYC